MRLPPQDATQPFNTSFNTSDMQGLSLPDFSRSTNQGSTSAAHASYGMDESMQSAGTHGNDTAAQGEDEDEDDGMGVAEWRGR